MRIADYLPYRLRAFLSYWFKLKVPVQKITYKRKVAEIREKNHANFLAIASSLSMWRYEEICLKLMTDSRFSVLVAVYPVPKWDETERKRECERISDRLASKSIPYVVINDDKGFQKLKSGFQPDIICYPQPYNRTFPGTAEWSHNLDCLLVYLPYCLYLETYDWCVNLPMQNLLWRQYMASDLHKREAKKIAYNHAENAVVVGEPRCDELLGPASSDPWKKIPDGIQRKRLIWSPHFQIEPNDMFYRPDFLWTHQLMLDLAKEYKDRLQIAFKPHPGLRTKLYGHKDWGVKKTDEYYRQWETMENTQLESGDYIDLFKTSDAMIHNCGSFIGEYLYVNKPVAFTTKDKEEVCRPFHTFGLNCFSAHYIVESEAEIRTFINDVVLCGNDTLLALRNDIVQLQMKQINGKSVSEDVYNDLVKSLFNGKIS